MPYCGAHLGLTFHRAGFCICPPPGNSNCWLENLLAESDTVRTGDRIEIFIHCAGRSTYGRASLVSVGKTLVWNGGKI
jgi:hypothetical protein